MRRRQPGYLLLPVALALALIAAVAFLVNQESGRTRSAVAAQRSTDAARLLAEAAAARLEWQLDRSNCTAYADLATANLGDGSIAATVTPKSGTPVQITATGTLPDGSQASVVRKGVALFGAPQTLTLQPGGTGADTTLSALYRTTNYGGSTVLYFERALLRANVLLRFDVSAIPATARIYSARLSLYQTQGSSGAAATLDVHRLTRAWTEGTKSGLGTADGATWNTYDASNAWTMGGGDYEAAPAISAPLAGAGGSYSGWQSVDIAPLMAAWVSGRQANHGLLLTLDTVSGDAWVSGIQFESSESVTAANRPKLEISYALPCGTVVPPTVRSSPPMADTELDGYLPTINWGGDVEAWLEYNSRQERMALRFDLQTIAPGTNVTEAKLRVYAFEAVLAANTSVNVYALAQSWDEGTKLGSGTADGATWNNRRPGSAWTTAGGTVSGAAVATQPVLSTFKTGWIEFDVTTLAQQWVDAPAANHGALLRVMNTGSLIKLSTREAAANKPELIVTYK